MSQSADEARAARIQKYKEERRKQLTARTATLFSANVTERRPRKVEQVDSGDSVSHMKSSSELNISVASTSVPIRTTRTSRLRAAAASNSSDSSPRKSSRSSSVTSLLEDAKYKSLRNPIVDRDKSKLETNRRQSYEEKENLKRNSGRNLLEKEIGAIKTKTKHSISKNAIDKDKSKNLVISNKLSPGKESNSREDRGNVKHEDSKKPLTNNKLYKNKVFSQNVITSSRNRDKRLKETNLTIKNPPNPISSTRKNVKLKINDEEYELLNSSDEPMLKNYGHKIASFNDEELGLNVNDEAAKVKSETSVSVVPILTENGPRGLLGAVCVRKVERFSELLSNLCSPGEADLLFEDILAENGLGESLEPAHPQENADSHIHQGVRSVKNNRQMRSQSPHTHNTDE
ncbi:hypothetical protein EVAR_53215_1 [Eumeta japonica]|uniref:Uncharacterized protein n=1 Tax=Eumeta variegata TaxID=151549 RepID=A0A4C1XE97_EUMVA|nr:hypothetical protein EVAR_53215_1 [Eumeta japonica]